ncbi:hypothetical protein JYP51_18180 [Ponticoccus gilvus]|nr:hypothetical protein [Enemella evansiae]
MSARFITAILAVGALIATVSAAPARADNEGLKRAVGAAATLYLLGQALEGGKVEVNHRQYGHQREYGHRRQYGHQRQWHGNQRGHGKYKGHVKKRWQPAALPRHCVRQVGGRHKSRYALSAHCLDRNYRGKLPRACASRAWYKGKARPVYGIGCLKGRGYHLARR